MKRYLIIIGVGIIIGFILAPVDTAHVLAGSAKGFIDFVKSLGLH